MQQDLSQTQRKSIISDSYELSVEQPIQLHDIFVESTPAVLTENFKRKYKRELCIYIFRFRVGKKNRNWQIRKRLNEFLEIEHWAKKQYGKDAPILPIRRQSEITPSNVEYTSDFLLIFLKRLVEIVHNSSILMHFLEKMPSEYGSGIIHAEVSMKKHSGGRHNEATCSGKIKQLLCNCCRTWRKRYFTVTDQCVFYTLEQKSFDVKEMLPFSAKFLVLCGEEQTGHILGVIIISAYRKLELIGESVYQFGIFTSAIKESLARSPYRHIQRFRSFAGIRQNCYSKYYVDGCDYFSDLCDALLKAEKNLFITDWMMTPYFLLKRPKDLDDRSCRLDYILQSLAQKGVKIYIILYMEPKIALNNDSQFVQLYLQELHPNIKVLRHPNYILIPFLWSHHEKMVVIDQKLAYTGGFDLCYGRWDTQQHHLHNEQNIWKGADYCNFRIADIYKPRNFLYSNLDTLNEPRMPWHDIGIQIRGLSVLDLVRHFIQYWNFVNFQTKFNERELLLQTGRHSIIQKGKKSFFQKANRRQDLNMLDQTTENKQQWEFYNKFLEETDKHRKTIDFDEIRQFPRKIVEYFKQTDEAGERLLLPAEVKPSKKWGSQKHQIVRSAATWSMGLQENSHEESVYLAYQSVIQEAEHFIYIENQFFICRENKISDIIARKIEKAYKQKKDFKVVLMLPLLPGFEGDITDEASNVMRIQLHWEYQTISRGKNSLFQKLSHIPNLSDYLKVYSLRNHGLIGKKPVTQILYIHSKLMIVDDRVVILGSANINDRSLLGARDSQIAIVIEDEDIHETKFGYKVSKSAYDLRCKLYQEHFALSEAQCQNFLSQQIWEKVSKRARNNTQIYRELFGCYPDDTMKTLSEIKSASKKPELDFYLKLKEQIIGFVVDWPLYFLQKQDLSLKPSQKEYYMPEINFT